MISRRKLIAATMGVSSLGGLWAAAPAAHASSATITLNSTGSLTVTEPTTTVNLGTFNSGYGPVSSNPFGAVTVTDTRAGSVVANNWIASATGTDFTLSGTAPAGATSAQTKIPVASMTYSTGTVTDGTGNATTCQGSAVAAVTPALINGTAVPVVTQPLTCVGLNTESWNPTLSITLAGQVAGTYNGAITHSVL